MPVKFEEDFLMQIAYFPPHTIKVVGEGSYPSIWIETLRVRNRQFLSYVEQAQQIVLQKWLDDMLARLKRKKNGLDVSTDTKFDNEFEDESIYETSGSSEDEDDSNTLLKSRRDTTKMLEVVEVVDQDELDSIAREAKETSDINLFACHHHYHRKSRSPLTGKLSPMVVENGRGLGWNRSSFLDRRHKKLQEHEKQYQASRKKIDYACGHAYHQKSRSSPTSINK
jgi:hypothetical protein